MITDFCVICGTDKDLENHHIVPKVKGGTDEFTNLITVCSQHHGMIHGMRPNSWDQRKELQKIGIEKAKREGKFTGRKATVYAKQNLIIELHNQGFKPSVIARELNIGVASVYRYRHGQKPKHKHRQEEPQKLPSSFAKNIEYYQYFNMET
jgi:hypothetical protein